MVNLQSKEQEFFISKVDKRSFGLFASETWICIISSSDHWSPIFGHKFMIRYLDYHHNRRKINVRRIQPLVYERHIRRVRHFSPKHLFICKYYIIYLILHIGNPSYVSFNRDCKNQGLYFLPVKRKLWKILLKRSSWWNLSFLLLKASYSNLDETFDKATSEFPIFKYVVSPICEGRCCVLCLMTYLHSRGIASTMLINLKMFCWRFNTLTPFRKNPVSERSHRS